MIQMQRTTWTFSMTRSTRIFTTGQKNKWEAAMWNKRRILRAIALSSPGLWTKKPNHPTFLPPNHHHKFLDPLHPSRLLRPRKGWRPPRPLIHMLTTARLVHAQPRTTIEILLSPRVHIFTSITAVGSWKF